MDTLLKKIWETGSTDQRHDSGRLTYAYEENVTAVDELIGLLCQEDQTQTLHARYPAWPDRQVWHRLASCGSITAMLDWSVFFDYQNACFLLLLVSYICISQGSVATQLWCGGIFNNRVMANFSQSALVKMLKSVNIWRIYGPKLGGTLLWPAV